MSSETLDTSLDQVIKLDVPGGEYSITTYRESDIESMYEAFQLEAIMDELISVPKPYTRDTARFWLDAQVKAARTLLPLPTARERNAALFDEKSDQPFRQVPMMVIRHGEKMIGYHKKRIMQSATRAVLKYSANQFGIRKVIGRAEGENIASQKIISKLAEEIGGKGAVEPSRGKEKWPENKKGGEVRDVLTWEWSVSPDAEFEF